MTMLSAEPFRAAPLAPGPYESFIAGQRERVRRFYDDLSDRQLKHNDKFHYFRERLARLLQHFIPEGVSVLDVGCGTGDMLARLKPSPGVGIDCSGEMIRLARQRHPDLTYCQGFGEDLDRVDVPQGPYQFITLINSVGEMADVGQSLQRLHSFCSAETRLIIVQYNYLWEPICRLAARLGLRLNNPMPNWLAPRDLEGVLHLSGYQVVRTGHSMPLPIRLPGLNAIFNSFLGRLRGFRKLGFISYVVARPIVTMETPERYTASVVVPCKNEEGNIEGLVNRIPEMGAGTEIVFVDDKSTDRTAELVREAIDAHPEMNIKLVSGPGQGKGAACRAGFAAATGDVFMILDADMTVMPEELPAFFDAITRGRGEFINGSRMVYPLEDEAMRPLNILGNKMFATLFSLLLEQRIRDTLCGTKVVWKHDYTKLMASRGYFGSCDVWGDYDWIFGAAKNNLKIVELPVHYRERTAGVTKMTKRFRNARIMLKMCGIAFRKLRWV